MTRPTVTAEAAGTEVLGKLVSELQTGVAVNGNAITGTLNYVTGYTEFSGDPAEQSGYFVALKFTTDDWADYTSVKIGFDPSVSSGLVELINDPDKNFVGRVSDKGEQLFKMVVTDKEGFVTTQTFSLTGLTLNNG